MAYNSSYDIYLDFLGTWAGNPILPSQWYVLFHFDNLPIIKNNISGLLNLKEGTNDWRVSDETKTALLHSNFQYNSDSNIGCIFAKQITLPPEKVNAGHSGLSYGGYQSPVTVDNRDTYEGFKIDFLETNSSFVDFIIRPWVALTSYYGFVARKDTKNVKCRKVEIIFLAKTGPGVPMKIRKIYSFDNVAPISVNGENYSHADDKIKLNAANFVYDKYTIHDAFTPSYINEATGLPRDAVLYDPNLLKGIYTA